MALPLRERETAVIAEVGLLKGPLTGSRVLEQPPCYALLNSVI